MVNEMPLILFLLILRESHLLRSGLSIDLDLHHCFWIELLLWLHFRDQACFSIILLYLDLNLLLFREYCLLHHRFATWFATYSRHQFTGSVGMDLHLNLNLRFVSSCNLSFFAFLSNLLLTISMIRIGVRGGKTRCHTAHWAFILTTTFIATFELTLALEVEGRITRLDRAWVHPLIVVLRRYILLLSQSNGHVCAVLVPRVHGCLRVYGKVSLELVNILRT